MNAEAVTEPVVQVDSTAVSVDWWPGTRSRLPHLWLRDNCRCDECRIVQTSEKRFLLNNVLPDLVPARAELLDDVLHLEWPDGHSTAYHGAFLRSLGDDQRPAMRPWPERFVPQRFDFNAFLADDRVALSALDEFVEIGAILLVDAPTERGTLESLAPRLGPVREVLFARIHDVQVDPRGYNVAHTALPLPPHNDFASYAWPPSVQALHMLANECDGGRSIIVDGWSLLAELRSDRPDFFDALCRMPVPFREFDDDNETYAMEPIVRLDVDGDITGFRFSNQLMQAIDPNLPDAPGFYAAYHELCCRVTDSAIQTTFRLEGGQILIVAAHRVLHGREAFEATGRRHLQDAYFEFDNARNYRRVLQKRIADNG